MDVALLRTHNPENEDDETSYDVVREDGTVVGDLCVWENDGSWGIAGIGIAAPFTGEGYGREAMRQFFLRHPSLRAVSGESVYESEGFWEALGCRWLAEGGDPYRPFELDRDAILVDG